MYARPRVIRGGSPKAPAKGQRMREPLDLAAWAFSVLLLVPAPAHGYIDPISGSIILQVVAASALAGLFTIKRFWRHVRSVAGRIRKKHLPR